MKNEILNMFQTSGQLALQDVIVNIVMSAVLGFFIFLSYAISHRGTIYSKKFNASLVILTVLTGTVMTVIGNNIALSLGMVGALSIVRFRTAIKDSRDSVYIFWTQSIIARLQPIKIHPGSSSDIYPVIMISLQTIPV